MVSKTSKAQAASDPASNTEPRRIRLTVPPRDVTVNEWLDEQDNSSASVRHLIREYVKSNGVTDPLTIAVEPEVKAGRPTLAELQRRERAIREALIEMGITPDAAAVYLAKSDLVGPDYEMYDNPADAEAEHAQFEAYVAAKEAKLAAEADVDVKAEPQVEAEVAPAEEPDTSAEIAEIVETAEPEPAPSGGGVDTSIDTKADNWLSSI